MDQTPVDQLNDQSASIRPALITKEVPGMIGTLKSRRFADLDSNLI